MSDDLVKRAREWNFCWPSHDVEMLVPAMADRIEELEVKLAHAMAALKIDPWFIGYSGWKKYVKDTLSAITETPHD